MSVPTPTPPALETALESSALPTEPMQANGASYGVNGVTLPPCNLDSDEPPLESYQHLQQLLLLLTCLDWLWKDRNDYFAAGNLTVYYSARKLKSEDFREKQSEPLFNRNAEEAVQTIFGPDFFVVLETEKRPRKSWTIWEEDGKYPNVIVELLSDSTAKIDRDLKKRIYQNTFRTPDYFWFDPHSLEFAGFHLLDGAYQAIAPTEQGWLWSEQLALYLGIHQDQLRFFTPEGVLVPSPPEAAEAAQQQAEAAQQQAEAERQRSEVLRAKLRELGVDPDSV